MLEEEVFLIGEFVITVIPASNHLLGNE